MTEVIINYPSKAALVQLATALGYYNATTKQIIAQATVDAGGSYFFNNVGQVVATPAVYDNSTSPPTIITPAVMAPGLWGRLRVNGDTSSLPQIIAACRALGVVIYERGEDGAWIDAPDFVDRVGVVA